MSKKEQFTSIITCKKCGVSGTAYWEENENPVHGGGLDTRLLKVSGEFYISGKSEIRCRSCGSVV